MMKKFFFVTFLIVEMFQQHEIFSNQNSLIKVLQYKNELFGTKLK